MKKRTKNEKENNELVFAPLGGVGEIGMNFALYGYGPPEDKRWIIVDIGVTFAGDDMPGIDLILPDIQFARERKIEAIVITHAHEDHYGALLTLWPELKAQVFCTPFTAGLIKAKQMMEKNRVQLPIKLFEAGDKFEAGPFEIEAVYVNHSIPEPVSLMIRSPLGNVIHTGDWKLDDKPMLGKPTDEAHFKRLGKEGVRALICDSTNAMRAGESPTETEICANIAEFMAQAKGRVIVTTFSSNVGRIRSVALAAQKTNRKVMIIGHALRRVIAVARDLGYLDDIDEFVSEGEFRNIDRKSLVIVCTGSQGEPRAALKKLARKEHPKAQVSAGDMVIFSSRTIPGNEREVIDIQNQFVSQGIDIVIDGEHGAVHVSGHPRRAELRKMFDWVKPDIGIPVHGEARHLIANAQLMRESGIGEVLPIFNGQMVRLAPGIAEAIDEAPVGRIVKDGNVTGSAQTTGLSQRKKLAFAGHIAIALVLDKNGNMMDDMLMSSIGIPAMPMASMAGGAKEEENLEDALYDAALEAFESIQPKARNDDERVEQAMMKAVRACARDIWGKKPMVTVFVSRVKAGRK